MRSVVALPVLLTALLLGAGGEDPTKPDIKDTRLLSQPAISAKHVDLAPLQRESEPDRLNDVRLVVDHQDLHSA